MPKYIDADELLRKSIRIEGHFDLPGGKAQNFSAIIDTAIINFPAADVAPVVHGYWESSELMIENGCTSCSKCKTEYYISDLEIIGGDTLPPHCPNCGATMDRKEGAE